MWLTSLYVGQGCNHEKNLVVTSTMVGRICSPDGDRVNKVSENLGAAVVDHLDMYVHPCQ